MDKTEFIRSIADGNLDFLNATMSDVSSDFRTDPEVTIAIRRAADRVVFHRPHYREMILRLVETGFPCDIWTAARSGLLEQVQRLVAADQELIDATDDQGRTPLQRSTLVYGKCEECEAVANWMIQQGARIDIFSAATLGLLPQVRNCLVENPQIVSSRCEGSAPLNWAVRPRKNNDSTVQIVQLLLDSGADIHDKDTYENEMTPLHHAAEWGLSVCVAVCESLLNAGADPLMKDQNQWTALDYARDRGREKIVELLDKS